MAEIVLLDTGPLGLVTHPRATPEIVQWLNRLLASGTTVLVPEIADYELRRELLRANKTTSVARLDALKQTIGYLPLTTAAMMKAAELWAAARSQGKPTAVDAALDGDVILAAQAVTYSAQRDIPVIATTNVGHLSLFVEAQNWQDIR